MLINAIARLKGLGIDIYADIAGSGPSESELHSAVDRLALVDTVRFLGWREDISDLLSSWDLLVMPSLDEGFPIAVLQAMAEARPVVASKVGGLTELVVDGLTGRLIPSGDLDALVPCPCD
jgi:glycosyltransferase involved in cell wall biosynthesis